MYMNAVCLWIPPVSIEACPTSSSLAVEPPLSFEGMRFDALVLLLRSLGLETGLNDGLVLGAKAGSWRG
jgi:hypothetical protein